MSNDAVLRRAFIVVHKSFSAYFKECHRTSFIIVNVVSSYPFQGKPYVENGRQWAAHDIGLTHKTCAWMPHGFMSVNTDIGAGWAFLRSLYRQYADWGVDFGMLFLNLYFSLV